jgi:hypothetical protein
VGHHLSHLRHSSFAAAALVAAALRLRPLAAGVAQGRPQSIRDGGAGMLLASELGQTTRMRGLGWNESQAEALC